MSINTAGYKSIIEEIGASVTLVAVSKTKPVEDIKALYDLGQRHFGENYVQELTDKYGELPPDIKWHFIGHLQSNKVRSIAPFISLIQSVDSLKLLKEIDKQAKKAGRIIDCLLQVHIASEETKFGLDEKELEEIFLSGDLTLMKNINIKGLMGMASFTDDEMLIKKEFSVLKLLFNKFTTQHPFNILSMGMSSDFRVAIDEASNMVRIGSLIFGERTLRKS